MSTRWWLRSAGEVRSLLEGAHRAATDIEAFIALLGAVMIP